MSEAISNYCPNCGTERTEGARFCTKCGHDFESQPVTPRGSTPPVQSLNVAAVVTIAGGALAVVGSFLPWLSATAGLVGTIERNGIDGGGDGIATLVLGGLVALFGLVRLATPDSEGLTKWGAFIFGVLLVAVAVIDYGSVSDRLKSLDNTLAVGSVGAGIYVVALGGIIAAIGGSMSAPKRNA